MRSKKKEKRKRIMHYWACQITLACLAMHEKAHAGLGLEG